MSTITNLLSALAIAETPDEKGVIFDRYLKDENLLFADAGDWRLFILDKAARAEGRTDAVVFDRDRKPQRIVTEEHLRAFVDSVILQREAEE